MIRYNLQFFAKDGPGGEKTEPATGKKLKEAREKGQVAKSQDLTGGISLLASFILLKVYVGILGRRFIEGFGKSYNQISDIKGNSLEVNDLPNLLGNRIDSAMTDVLLILLPILAVGFAIGFISNLVQVKWKPTTKPLKPKFDKFNPVNGIKRIFSTRTLVTLIKQIAIVSVCIIMTYNKLKDQFGLLLNLYDVSLSSAIIIMGDMILSLGISISVIYLIIGFADYIYERVKFKNEMKMTKQEVKDEWKDTEGNPEIKGRQKRRMMEVSRKRMMQAVPQADVVITNPTHFAVALKYDEGQEKAPYVVAKGEDYLAFKIKEVARDNNVEIVENKLLARTLYYNVDIGMEIPKELYQAVAEILVYVYKVKHRI